MWGPANASSTRLLPRPPIFPRSWLASSSPTLKKAGGWGYPNSSWKPVTSEIPPVTFAERRYLVISAGQVRIPPGVGPGGHPGRQSEEERFTILPPRAPSEHSRRACPFPHPSVSHSPTKLLGDRISKPREFHAKASLFRTSSLECNHWKIRGVAALFFAT